MPELAESHVGLRIFGADLEPENVTQRLGRHPTRAWRKGAQIQPSKTEHARTRATGAWILDAAVHRPADIDTQVREILDGLSNDPTVWTQLNREFDVDLFIGLFMDDRNEGLEISPMTLLLLGARGIALSFDIYDPVADRHDAAEPL